jgi:hypothetical protein
MAVLAIASIFVGAGTYAYTTGGSFTIDFSSPKTIKPVISGLSPGDTIYIVIKVPNPHYASVTAKARLLNVLCDENVVVEPEQEWYTAHQVQEKNDIDSVITFGLWIDRDGDTGGCDTSAGDEWKIEEKAGIHIDDIAGTPIPMGTINPGKTITVITSYHMDEETENWAQSDTMTFNIELTREKVSTEAPYRIISPPVPPPPPPRPAEFVLSDLSITPSQVNVTETVSITITASNVGEQTGSYTVTLWINDVVEATRTITLEGGKSVEVTFKVTKDDPGTYNVKVDELTGRFEVKAPAPPPRPAEFLLSGLIIVPKEGWIEKSVANFTISLLVTNVGDLEGSTTVDLLVNGVKEQSKSVTLAGGARTTVSFSVTKTTVGSYTVKVGDLTGSFTVKEAPPPPPPPTPPKPAEFEVSDLVVSPGEVVEGESVNVTVKVTNVGEEEGTHTVDLKVDGLVVDSETVTLAGGASATVSFSVTKTTVGSYTVKVGDLTGSFTVTAPPTVSIWLSPGYIAGILIIISAAIASVYALYRRGRLPLHNLPKRTPGASNQ